MLVSATASRRALIAGVFAIGLISASGGAGAQLPQAPLATAMPGPQFAPAPTAAADQAWLAASRPLGPGAPGWARRMYRDSLLVLRRLADPEGGAIIAGARPGWDHVWPRDAAAAALALAAAGHRGDASRAGDFLAQLDLGRAARFDPSGTPVPGRPAAGDAEGWLAVAKHAGGLPAPASASGPWRGRQDYAENDTGDFLGNAIAAGAPAGEVLAGFGSARGLSRDPGESALDSAAAWAIVPFARPGLATAARRTLLTLAAGASHYGIAPTEDWTSGEAWTAPTAWSAWALARVGETRAADRLLAGLRRAATPEGALPERVSSSDGRPLSTTPLAWSHAFAALALRERYEAAPG